MPKYIIKIKDRYFIWSTIVDAPLTYGMTEEDLQAYFAHAKNALRALPERLARVAKTGTSALDGLTLEKLLAGNRAGEKEAHLTMEEIYKRYAVKTGQPTD